MQRVLTSPRSLAAVGDGRPVGDGSARALMQQAWPDDAKPLVSICCITYNHASFIRQCIEGFLIQQTTFPVEVLIHDDASTDDTQALVREYARRFPRVIKPVLQVENQRSRGLPINLSFNFPRARGRYIALCEGDDYWTDPGKIQRQAEFLDRHPDHVLVAENSIWRYQETGREVLFSERPERDIELLELLDSRQFATGSVMFRNLGVERLRAGPISGDTILWCHLTRFGRLRYVPHVSSVYRRHAGGDTSVGKTQWAKRMITWNAVLRHNHPEVHDHIFIRRNMENFENALEVLVKQGRLKDSLSTIDELAGLTDQPEVYKALMLDALERLTARDWDKMRKRAESAEAQLAALQGSLSLRIGRGATLPLRLLAGLLRLRVDHVPDGSETTAPKRSIDRAAVLRGVKELAPMSPPQPPRAPRLIVSMTSYPARIDGAFFAIVSLLRQSLAPDLLVLWLGKEQFPGLEADLSPDVLGLQRLGLTIRWCSNLRSYTKLVPALREFPDDVIVTADDDVYYEPDWLERLHRSFLADPGAIHAHRAHRVVVTDQHHLAPYSSWPKSIGASDASSSVFATGVGGVLYPPHCLHPDVLDENLFGRLCPYADDIWFWAMAARAGTKVRVLADGFREPTYIDPEAEVASSPGQALYTINRCANDAQLAAVIEHFRDIDGGSIVARLLSEATSPSTTDHDTR